ncbi:MAG: cytochrome C [Desulfuromonas sp.]|nr:MAG: cytochrome C [Desulfuromonas sp.]
MRILLLLSLTLVPAVVAAIESPSIETGLILFESRQLGTSGKSCQTCHPQGDGLADSIYLDGTELIKTINLCIRKPLQGEALDPSSTEMDSLVMYLRSLYPAAP